MVRKREADINLIVQTKIALGVTPQVNKQAQLPSEKLCENLKTHLHKSFKPGYEYAHPDFLDSFFIKRKLALARRIYLSIYSDIWQRTTRENYMLFTPHCDHVYTTGEG